MAWSDSGIVLPSSTRYPVYVPEGAARVPWRLCTNFTDAKRILERFGDWPDSLVPPLTLQALYEGKGKEAVTGLVALDKDASRPCFPYLDEREGALIGGLLEAAKPALYPGFKASLEEAGYGTAHCADHVLLALQTLLVFSLRQRERMAGIWELRSPGQKLGGVFALSRHVPAHFTRVSAFVMAGGRRLCFPWGGGYGEYCKILPMMEDAHTGQVLQTADEELRVLPVGATSRALVLLELVDAGGITRFKDQQARLTVDLVEANKMAGVLPFLARAAGSVAQGAKELLRAIVELWRKGRYSYLEGPGDYLEMAYSVVEGLLFRWAMEDGLLGPPPAFEPWGDWLIVRKPLLAKVMGRRARFPGICVLDRADGVWESLLRYAA